MTSFTDNAGRTWEVAITVATAKRVRSLTGVDLMSIADPEADLLGRLAGDPILLVDALYAAIKPAADARDVTDEDFGESLAGDALGRAVDALLEAVVESFHHAPTRENLRKALALSKRAADRVAEVGAEAISSGAVERRIDEAVEGLRQSISGDSSTASPASSESTPAA